jgi:hypothetical protein
MVHVFPNVVLKVNQAMQFLMHVLVDSSQLNGSFTKNMDDDYLLIPTPSIAI